MKLPTNEEMRQFAQEKPKSYRLFLVIAWIILLSILIGLIFVIIYFLKQ